jgi:hypothetical protein
MIKHIIRRVRETLARPICAVYGCKPVYQGQSIPIHPNYFIGCARCGRCVLTGKTFAQWYAEPAIPTDDDHEHLWEWERDQEDDA